MQHGRDWPQPAADDKAKDLVIKAGGWLSNRFGEGEGADFSAIAAEYEKFGTWCRAIITNSPISAAEWKSSLTQALQKSELPSRLAATEPLTIKSV